MTCLFFVYIIKKNVCVHVTFNLKGEIGKMTEQEWIDIFADNPNIKQIGAVGCINDNTYGSNGLKRIGHVIVGGIETKICNFNHNDKFGLEEAVTIDPNIIVTAYDENWIEEKDVDVAMIERCEKIRNLGYKSVVLLQEKPWCLYDNDSLMTSE